MKKRGLAYLLTATMVLSMLMGVPATSMKVKAASTTVTVGDFKITGESLGNSDYSYDEANGIVTIKSSKTMTITSATKTNRTSLYIAKDVDANLVLKNIDMSLAYVPGKVGIEIADDSSGKVTLFLDGENSIITRNASAIQKNGSQGTLTISDYDSGSNQLFAYTSMKDVSECGATIGSAANKDCYNITINGGKVYVASSSSGAAIGGGCNGDGNNITISGGMVHACGTSLVTSGSINGGAAIGGGYCGDGNNITISGGTVHARFYDNGETVSDTFMKTKVKPLADYNINGGAGIGGGYYGDGNNITISGGVLDVEGDSVANYASAGIGAGGAGSASNINITGGQITAVGGTSTNVKDGAGIGTGGRLSTELGGVVDVTISGGTIVAQGGATAPGIGAGDGMSAKVIITGGSINAIPGKTAYTNSRESITEKSDAIGLSAYSKACIDRSKYKRYVVRSESEIVEGTDTETIQLKTHQFSGESNTSAAGRLEFKLNGSDYAYNTTGMMTDSDGYVYVYVDPNVEITEKNADGELILKYNGSETLQDCYNEAVTITADGYTIATSQSGTYSSSYTFSESGTKTLYFKGAVSGKVTSKTITVKIDTTKPTGTINIDGKQYSTINATTGTGKYQLSNTWVTISATDTQSTVESIQYGLSSSYYSTEANIESKISWSTYNSGFAFPSNEAKAIYVKIKDSMGNVRYLSTPIIYNDTIAPENAITATSTTASNATFTFTVKDENASNYAYVLLKSTETAPTDWNSLVNKITTANGGKGNITSGSKTFTKTISGLEANENYTFYLISKNTLKNLSGITNEKVSSITKSAVTTSRLTTSGSNQELQIKAGLAATSYTYDLKNMLSAADVASMKNLQYSCTAASGSILSKTGQLDVSNGVVTVPVNANLIANQTQNIIVTFTSSNYETITATLTVRTIDKTPVTLSGVAVSNATYDGKQHGYTGTVKWMENGTQQVNVSGTDITYEGVNGTTHSDPTSAPVNAGTYRVTFAVKSSDGNYTGTQSYTYTISKASLRNEMSNVAWYFDDNTKINADTYSSVYDGSAHEVKVKNYSSKVTVSYSGTTSHTNVGTYDIAANFTVSGAYANNYELPTDVATMRLTWTIADKITPDMSQVSWVYQQGSTQEAYDVGSTKLVENGKDYTVSVIGLPTGVVAEYDGTCVAKSAGTYNAKVVFNVTDSSKYYSPSPSSMTLSWSIEKAPTTEEDDDTTGGSGGNTGDDENDADDNTGSNPGGTTGGGNVSDGDSDTTTKVPSVGTTKEVGSNKYKVTTSSTSGGTVEYTAPVNKSSAGKVVIPATVTIDGKTYKVTSVAKNAFSGCKKLTSVTIPNGVTSIGANAFKKCTSLKTVKIPNSVTSIGSNAFNGCKKLTKATIGNGVKTIGNGAFSGCSKLKTISIKSTCKLTKIGDKAFYKCTSLTKITLPKNLTTIGKQAFFGCKKLKTITIKSKKLKKVGTKAIKGINKKATIKCPSKSYVKKYKKLFKSKTGFAKTMKIK